ncbi:MAG: galactokinase [Planctomycetes bacterium]|nr:galactokinase [Planctomycetota bacterium]MCB9910648.1 galactokinase [Planctomycetota bacterium]
MHSLEFWLDPEASIAEVIQRGLGPVAAQAKALLLAQCAEDLLARGASIQEPVLACYCPGRLEVFGKHTDYAGGRSLIAAPDWGIVALARPLPNREVRLHSRQAGPDHIHLLEADTEAPDTWARYPVTACLRLAHNSERPLLGADLAFASDLPIAAGMSSSSALLTATLLLLMERNALAQDPPFARQLTSPARWALFASCVENGQSFGGLVGDRGVGTFGGSEDHTAMLCARAGRMQQVGFGPLMLEREVTLDPEFVFVVAQSGVLAEKARGARSDYNRLALMVRTIADIAQAHAAELAMPPTLATTGSTGPEWIPTLLRHDPENAARLRPWLSRQGEGFFSADELLRRFDHFVLESETWIPALPDHWNASTIDQVAGLTALSTQAAETLLGNQVPATMALAQALLAAGAHAASPFGAGFGGSVWGLVTREQVPNLLGAMHTRRLTETAAPKGWGETAVVGLGPAAWVTPWRG